MFYLYDNSFVTCSLNRRAASVSHFFSFKTQYMLDHSMLHSVLVTVKQEDIKKLQHVEYLLFYIFVM